MGDAAGTQCVSPGSIQRILSLCVHLLQHQSPSTLISSKHFPTLHTSSTPATQVSDTQVSVFLRRRKLGQAGHWQCPPRIAQPRAPSSLAGDILQSPPAAGRSFLNLTFFKDFLGSLSGGDLSLAAVRQAGPRAGREGAACSCAEPRPRLGSQLLQLCPPGLPWLRAPAAPAAQRLLLALLGACPQVFDVLPQKAEFATEGIC